jgi:putative tryptophan/tyrosine transport system substrate-binding protein
MIRRSDFITLFGGAAAGWPLAARAQQSAMPVIGFLNGQSQEDWADRVDAVRQGLSQVGFVEGRNVGIEYRFAQSDADRLSTLAAELVSRKVDVIVASGGELAGRAAAAATSSIPIVATFGSDPVEGGLVASLNRPGRNLTGVSLFNVALAEKQVEVLHEAFPDKKDIAALINPRNFNAERFVAAAESATRVLGLRLIIVKVENDREMDDAFLTLAGRSAGALVVLGDPFFTARRKQLVALSARHSIPTMYFSQTFVEAGGLMSYGSNRIAEYQQVGVYAGRILKGDKPAELPILQPTKVEFIVNLKTAKSLGLALPPSLLARADEVIE